MKETAKEAKKGAPRKKEEKRSLAGRWPLGISTAPECIKVFLGSKRDNRMLSKFGPICSLRNEVIRGWL